MIWTSLLQKIKMWLKKKEMVGFTSVIFSAAVYQFRFPWYDIVLMDLGRAWTQLFAMNKVSRKHEWQPIPNFCFCFWRAILNLNFKTNSHMNNMFRCGHWIQTNMNSLYPAQTRVAIHLSIIQSYKDFNRNSEDCCDSMILYSYDFYDYTDCIHFYIS